MWAAHSVGMTSVSLSFLGMQALSYEQAIHKKTNASEKCIGFIDGTVIGISRPNRNKWQNVVYKGRKRKHVLKY